LNPGPPALEAQTDDFTFTVEIKEHMLSRRGILSTISMYDPLGFIAPLLLRAKLNCVNYS